MEDKLILYNLFKDCCNSSNIVYCDGMKRYSITFDELSKTVSYLSEHFRNLFLSQSIVCCLMKPSFALPAVILGILKISSTFAFLDIYKPYESLQAFQKHLEVKTLLVEECYIKNLESKLCCCWEKTKKLFAYSDFVILQSKKCENDACPNSKKYKKFCWHSEISYAVQTSGTTGEPKIVQVPHNCIISNIVDFRSRFSVTADDVILQSTKITFDPSIIEIFLSLSSGATLVIIAEYIRSMPKKLIEVIVSNSVTILQGTPSLISNFGERILREVLLKKESVLRILALGGEVCPPINKLQRWKSEGNKTEIYNLYGLTEISCWASCFKIDFTKGDSLPSVPIGEPLLNTKLEIHNEEGNIADKGELFIGGYKRFCIINEEEWPEKPDYFMRSTGDMVYKADNDFIYFEGRNDSIIKYMGHKISLHLLNNIMGTFPEVAYHFLHFDLSSARLYLFVVWSSFNSFDKSEVECRLLKSFKLIQNLPVVIFVPVPFIPVTKHGKADNEKLMSLVSSSSKKRAFCANSITDEICDDIISTLWKNYTRQLNIVENDMFILKGGDSISAVQFAAEIEWHFQLSLPLLVEKLLNKSFKEICKYVKLCLKDNNQPVPFHEDHANYMESTSQPLLKKKCYEKSHCFKVCFKQGCFEQCLHAKDSESCFHRRVENFQNSEPRLKLAFKWNLKKCIDATPCILHRPMSDEILIFIGSHFGMFSCIDANKRAEKWQVLVPDRIESSACISACGNYVLFGCYDHHLYCVNISDGSIYWKYETGAEVKSSPSVSLTNTAFVGSHDKHVYAVDVQSGFLLWKKQISYASIFSSPAILEKLHAVGIGTLDGVFALLKMESGEVLWNHHSGKPLFSSPIVSSNSILIGSTDNCMLGLDFDGRKKFRYSTDGPVFSSGAYDKEFSDDQVVFGCHDSYLHCVTSNGELVWKTLCDSVVYATPFIFKWNNLYYACVSSSKGTIYFFQLRSGKIIFSWKCPGEIFSSPVILKDFLVIGCRDNNIYCFNIINFIEDIK